MSSQGLSKVDGQSPGGGSFLWCLSIPYGKWSRPYFSEESKGSPQGKAKTQHTLEKRRWTDKAQTQETQLTRKKKAQGIGYTVAGQDLGLVLATPSW